jgi:type II secretory pathway pseudopilin PulG
MKKGFTLLEILAVIFLLMVILGLTIITINPYAYFQRARDFKRINDLKALEVAINTYINVTSTPILAPPGRNVGETNQSIFISVPFDKEDRRSTVISGFYIYQASSTNYLKIDGNGWLPVNFSSLPYPPLTSLPIDPINSYSRKYFYSYVATTSQKAFEINANLESSIFKAGGGSDYTSTDGGDNANIFEVGNRKNLMPNNLY